MTKLIDMKQYRQSAYGRYFTNKDIKDLEEWYKWNDKIMEYLREHRFDNLSSEEVLNIKNYNNDKRNQICKRWLKGI